MPALPSTRPPRRSQSERRALTRGKLLDATIECLIERGYAGTTTTAVARTARVSQGALFAHFESKQALFCAAAEHLFAALIAEYRVAFAGIAAEDDRIGAAGRLLWDLFTRPPISAAFELYLAARTDTVLAERLRPVADRHGENLRQEARALFPEAAHQVEDFDARIDVVINAAQGLALGGAALRDDARVERMLVRLTEDIRNAFAPATAGNAFAPANDRKETA